MNNFINLNIENLNIDNIKNINHEKLNLDVNDFYENDIIIIKSGTATGKTRNIAKLSKDIKEHTNCNILSIVNLITLAREQINVFEENKIILKDYQKDIDLFNKSDGVICINSLYKLNDVKDFDIKNTILYMDEVNDLLKSITHNDSLNTVINLVYTFLIKLIKGCKKIIISDATIDKNIINLLKTRTENNKTILIINECKKFNNIKAIKYNDENLFIDKLRNQIKNKEYFLFGCDQCKKLTKIYLSLIDEFEEQKEDFILITSKTTYRPMNASNDFLNKYVFYSPSITTGVSFVYENVKQTQFIYISNNPLISPESIYQMSSRTRNQKELIYFCDEIKSKSQKFKTIKELENNYMKMIKLNERLMCLSKSINENDDVKIIENTFFKMFCYNEFKNSIFDTGYLEHCQLLLKNNGFILEEMGEYQKIDKTLKNDLDEYLKASDETEFNNVINCIFKPLDNEDDVHELELIENKYSILTKRIELLHIMSEEDAIFYKTYIIDDYALNNYFNFLNLFKNEDYINDKITLIKKSNFKIKNISNIFCKIQLLKAFETHYKIDRLNLNFDNVDETNEISKSFKELYFLSLPKQTAKKFNSKYELLKIYVNIIKNICGELPLIQSKRVKINKKCIYKYSVNEELATNLILLSKFKNPKLKFYNIELVEKITKIKPDLIDIYNCADCDENDIYNKYVFNKTHKI